MWVRTNHYFAKFHQLNPLLRIAAQRSSKISHCMFARCFKRALVRSCAVFDHMSKQVIKKAAYFPAWFRKPEQKASKKVSAANSQVCTFRWCGDDQECRCDVCCRHRDGTKTVAGSCSCKRCQSMWPFRHWNRLSCAAALGARST